MVARTAGACIEFLAIDLSTEVDPMPCWKLVLHPKVFPKLKRLLLMPGCAHTIEAKPLKERHQ